MTMTMQTMQMNSSNLQTGTARAPDLGSAQLAPALAGAGMAGSTALGNAASNGSSGGATGQGRGPSVTGRLAINQFLTFLLNGQDFGVEILQVREIRNFTKLTPIPNMPACVKGVLNLRGTVVPIVDLRSRFGMPVIGYDRFTVIIVVNVLERIMGVVVDAVSDVLNVESDAIVAPPEMGSTADTTFIKGLARADDRLVTLLNIEHLLNLDNAFTRADGGN